MIGALAVTDASRSAIRRTADETGQTRAQRYAVKRPAFRVGATGGRFTWRGRSWGGR